MSRSPDASLSRRGRQGSQRNTFPDCGARPDYRGGAGRVLNIEFHGPILDPQSIEEGPAGFSTDPLTAVQNIPVYRGGAGRVLNWATVATARSPSLSRRGRQGSQRVNRQNRAYAQSIEEGPAGSSTWISCFLPQRPVYRGGAGRVLNVSVPEAQLRASLSRRGRQGSQPLMNGNHMTDQSIEEGPAGFSTATRSTSVL